MDFGLLDWRLFVGLVLGSITAAALWVARYLSIAANAAATFLHPSAFKCRLSGSAMPGCLRTEIYSAMASMILMCRALNLLLIAAIFAGASEAPAMFLRASLAPLMARMTILVPSGTALSTRATPLPSFHR